MVGRECQTWEENESNFALANQNLRRKFIYIQGRRSINAVKICLINDETYNGRKISGKYVKLTVITTRVIVRRACSEDFAAKEIRDNFYVPVLARRVQQLLKVRSV